MKKCTFRKQSCDMKNEDFAMVSDDGNDGWIMFSC